MHLIINDHEYHWQTSECFHGDDLFSRIIALLDLSAEMHGIASGLFAFCKELQSLADLRDPLWPKCPNLVQK